MFRHIFADIPVDIIGGKQRILPGSWSGGRGLPVNNPSGKGIGKPCANIACQRRDILFLLIGMEDKSSFPG